MNLFFSAGRKNTRGLSGLISNLGDGPQDRSGPKCIFPAAWCFSTAGRKNTSGARMIESRVSENLDFARWWSNVCIGSETPKLAKAH